jgi:hypothetical protein
MTLISASVVATRRPRAARPGAAACGITFGMANQPRALPLVSRQSAGWLALHLLWRASPRLRTPRPFGGVATRTKFAFGAA